MNTSLYQLLYIDLSQTLDLFGNTHKYATYLVNYIIALMCYAITDELELSQALKSKTNGKQGVLINNHAISTREISCCDVSTDME